MKTKMLVKGGGSKMDSIVMSKERTRDDGRVFHTGSVKAKAGWTVVCFDPDSGAVTSRPGLSASERGKAEKDLVLAAP
jgi:hypothetical protein